MAETEAVLAASSGIRRFGAASLDMAYVAAGRFDGFWERGLNCGIRRRAWCWCARPAAWSAIFQGRTDGLNGQDIVCANEHIHPQLLKLLKQAGS